MSACIIQDTVISKRLGLPAIGKVVGYMDAATFAEDNDNDVGLATWEQHYPLWRSCMVVMVRVAGMTYFYPEEDLEVFDDGFVDGMSKGLLSRQES
jgi:hypothetical protein